MKLYIKNMVCPRCIMAVTNILQNQEIDIIDIRLGRVVISKVLSIEQKEKIKEEFEKIGFELLEDNQQTTIEQVKAIIIDQIHTQNKQSSNYSELLSTELHRNYSSISKLFSSVEGITIEQYIILQRIEKVKELLTYNQLTLSEIAFKLQYSSVAHLSAQFRKVTGFTPTQFKKEQSDLRKHLNKV